MPGFRSRLIPSLLVPFLGCVAGHAQVSSAVQQPASPPQVQLSGGELTIAATNSSLRTILDDLEHRTGTRVEGLTGDQRIYGVYGPGNPQQVLASLLDDSGYNVLISGRQADGSPRQIELSSKSAASTAAGAAPLTQAGQQDDDSDYSPAPTQQFPMPAPAQSAPGAATTPQIRTPQQMLQELERMRQNAQSQSPPSQSPQ